MWTIFLLAAAFQVSPEEWVVQEVMPPEASTDGHPINQWSVLPQGDLDGDGAADFLVHVVDFPSYRPGFLIYHGLQVAGSVVAPLVSGSPLIIDHLTLLNGPTGPVLISRSSNDFSLTSVPLTAKPARVIAESAWPAPFVLLRGEDVNGDGWEDLFFEHSNMYDTGWLGVINGRDLSMIWWRAIAGEVYPPGTRARSVRRLADLDGDGVGDIITAWPEVGVLPGDYFGHHLLAHSAAHGSLIWDVRYSEGQVISPGITDVPDLDGDGNDDFVLADPSFVSAYSSADGSRLWIIDPAGAFDRSPPVGFEFRMTVPQPMFSATPSAREDLMVPAYDFRIAGWGRPLYAIGHFDPLTGIFLGRGALPADLEPWWADPFEALQISPQMLAMDDIDRDGLGEYGVYVPITWAQPGQASTHFVILSMKTLTVPDQVSVGLGNGFDAEVRIPSGANLPCYLVMSRGFDRDGGLRLEGWKTHLAPDAWLDRSVATRSLQVTLDAQGHGTIHVPIPPDPNLVGATVYTKAVVLESSASDAEVWTLSTLGITELVL